MSGLRSLTVYFDGSCPMCRREMAVYRRLPQATAIDWVDVSAGAELGASLSCAQAMARFHVRDRQGRLFSGAAAFSQMWRLFPGWRWLGWLSAWPPLSPPSGIVPAPSLSPQTPQHPLYCENK